ncbi:uncharacterized protein NEMAJ01_0998 [Nematocida major]|uniref:uncharacterized protein n=1 Tax=Nematocida major TaxID=1912982 RepID=UPI002007A3D9|nr:uncharacterized protein NEMAJ01_0998 [Nematocida major]KAH9386102.1 hypothetical protein NEMAJ01_0998 [Nematocida major]
MLPHYISKGYIKAILLLFGAARHIYSLEVSTNPDLPGDVSILPYSAFFEKKKTHRMIGTKLPKAYLAGFEPFDKYVQALKFLDKKEDQNYKKPPNYINEEIFKRTIISVFYTKEYYMTLKNDWDNMKNIHIYNVYYDNFITMVNMANIPYFSKREGLYLPLSDINTILALYEIFSMNKYVRIPLKVKHKYGMDMTKRDCFKENMRKIIEMNTQANTEYLGILREIRYNGRPVLITEVPPERIDTKSWVRWILSREPNLDLVWYLYSTLCNTVRDNNLNHTLTYVKETSVLGKKGIQLFFSNKKAPSTDYVGLAFYLEMNNALKVRSIEVSIQEGLEVPEMHFSSVLEVFRKVEVVYVSSLGNLKNIKLNLSLVNIVLDFEKKRSERGMDRVLKGFVIYDYNSLNEFGKKQLLELNLQQVGFMTEIYRERVCVESEHPCLFRLNHRSPNFLGKFSIPQDKKANVRALVTPYDYVFEELNVQKLNGLTELDISLPEPEMKEMYKDSELPTVLRKHMDVTTVRLFGEDEQQQSSYVDMFKKSLAILSITHLDITGIPIMNSEILSVLESNTNQIKDKITEFSFTYFDPGHEESVNDKEDFSVDTSTFIRILQVLPNLSKMNVTILNDKFEASALIQDYKYLMKCGGTPHTEEQLRNIVNLKLDSPLLFTSVNTCDQILDEGMRRLQKPMFDVFYKTMTCPNGPNSEALQRMPIQELIRSLRDAIKPNMCRK